MSEILWFLLIGTLAAGVGQRVFHWWKDRGNTQLGMLLVSNVTGGLGLTALLPAIDSRIELWTGVTDLGGTVGRCLLMITFVTAQITFLLVVYPASDAWSRARLRIAGYALAVVAMVGLFILVRTGQPGTRFTLRDGARVPAVAVHLLLFYSGWAFDVIAVGRLSRRYSKIADGLWLRRGLGVLAVGCWIGLAYPIHQTGLLVALRLGAEPGDQTMVAIGLITACVIPVFGGLALPTVGPRLAGAVQWFTQYLQYRRLHPLWLALYQSAPDIAFEDPKRLDAVTVRDLSFRLYRRVIEIRDGMLAIRDLAVPDVSGTTEQLGRAAGLSGPDLEALVEAARIAAATREPSRPAVSHSGAHAQPPTPAARADLSHEIEWLLRVARAYRRSPIIKAAVAPDGQGGTPRPRHSEGSGHR